MMNSSKKSASYPSKSSPTRSRTETCEASDTLTPRAASSRVAAEEVEAAEAARTRTPEEVTEAGAAVAAAEAKTATVASRKPKKARSEHSSPAPLPRAIAPRRCRATKRADAEINAVGI
eukprot:3292479-Rhodomonas_salina.2